MQGVLATMGAELIEFPAVGIVRPLAGGVVTAEAFFANQKNLFPSHAYAQLSCNMLRAPKGVVKRAEDTFG